MRSPWLDMPLADYEAHMAAPEVAQAPLLASQFEALLREFSPASVAVIGCAGGNGFERIRPQITRRVVAVDINPTYLAMTSQRHSGRLPGLELIEADISRAVPTAQAVELIYAALLFEYVRPEAALPNLRPLCKPGGVLAALLQLPSPEGEPVSRSPYRSLESLRTAMNLVSPDELATAAGAAGFAPLSSRRIALRTSRRFMLQTFRLPGPAPGL